MQLKMFIRKLTHFCRRLNLVLSVRSLSMSLFLNPWQLLIYGLLGSATATLSVLNNEGLENYLLLVGGAWVMIVLPVNLILLYPVLILWYVFFKGERARMIACGLCSIASFAAGLVSLTAIMSV